MPGEPRSQLNFLFKRAIVRAFESFSKRIAMEENKGCITFKGSPLTLCGRFLKAGEKLPAVELIDQNMNPVNLSKFADKVCLISTAPSLDTPVCDLQNRRF